MADLDPATVLAEPLAATLMRARIPARLAYIGTDGNPRVVPVGFHWSGSAFILGTATTTPKVAAIRQHPNVALTIDTNEAPQDVLLVRGTARADVVEGGFPEYLDGARKLVPPENWTMFEDNARDTYDEMARIEITPIWAKLMDFETRVPSFLEEVVRRRES